MNQIEYARMYEAEDRHWWYVGLHALIITTIQRLSRKLGRSLRIYDAGCGTGRLSQLMAACGHNVEGCDASEEALRLCRMRGIDSMVVTDLNTIGLESEAYDVITSIDVLYHTGVVDDIAVMRRLRNGLKEDGILILNLVAHEFLRSTHDIAVHTRERYSIGTVCDRLEAAGFEVTIATYRVVFLFPLIFIYRSITKFLTNKCREASEVDSDVAIPCSIVNLLLLNTVKLENYLISSGTTMPIGTSVFVVARKIAITVEN